METKMNFRILNITLVSLIGGLLLFEGSFPLHATQYPITDKIIFDTLPPEQKAELTRSMEKELAQDDNDENLVSASTYKELTKIYENGFTGLMNLVANNAVQTIWYYLSQFPYNKRVKIIKTPGSSGETAVHVAIAHNNTKALKALLDSVKDSPDDYKALLTIIYTALTQKNDGGVTRFMNLVANNELQAIQYYLSLFSPNKRTEIIKTPSPSGKTAVYIAVALTHINVLEALLDSVKDSPDDYKALLTIIYTALTQRYDDGFTGLMNLVANNENQAIRDYLALFPHKIRVDILKIQNHWKGTAVHVAITYDNIKALEALLDSIKNNPDDCKYIIYYICDDEGRNALTWARYRHKNSGIYNMEGTLASYIAPLSEEEKEELERQYNKSFEERYRLKILQNPGDSIYAPLTKKERAEVAEQNKRRKLE